MKLNNLIKKYIILYVIVLTILLIISYKLLGLQITIIFNLILVVFSYVILEDDKKAKALFLIGTILWGIFPIIQMFDNPLTEGNISLSNEQIEQIANSVSIKFKEDFGNLGDVNISSIGKKCISNVTTFDYVGKGFNYSAYILIS